MFQVVKKLIVIALLVLSIEAAPAPAPAPGPAPVLDGSDKVFDTRTVPTTKSIPLWRPRSSWLAAPAAHITPINDNTTGGKGVPYVIIHHTVRPGACRRTVDCIRALRSMQTFHQQERGWDDIGYNFLIGGHGGEFAEIYEGRGFNVSGAHATDYNSRSVGIALIGDWSAELPPLPMLNKLKQLIIYGVQMGYIQKNYTLLGHRQVKATDCPGQKLFNEIKQWPLFMQLS